MSCHFPQLLLNLIKIEETPRLQKYKWEEGSAKSICDNLGCNLPPKALRSVVLSLCGTLTSSSGGWATESLSQLWLWGHSGAGIWSPGVGSLLSDIYCCDKFPVLRFSRVFNFCFDFEVSCQSVTRRSQRHRMVEV